MSNAIAKPTGFWSTLIELLHQRSQCQSNQRLYTFLLDGEAEEQHLTCRQLEQQAQAIAALLQSCASSGERALLLYAPGLEYIAAFFGCLYAGVIAVPAYPPDPSRLERTLPRLQAIAQDAQASVALTTSSILALADFLLAQAPGFPRLRWLATDADLPAPADWQPPTVDGDTVAFLQYTSGSTAAPKGVMLSHANLLHNSALVYDCFGHSSESQGVIWLPPYHDMGLIGGIIQPLYGGFPVTLLSPLDFLRRPFRWLQAISRYKATTSGGPNFAYDLCVRKITPEQCATLDLSRWDLAFNGAEAVRHQTMERFATAFEVCGFHREAFYPCYGLAEATLIVSGGHKTEPPVVQNVNGTALSQDRVQRVPLTHPDAKTPVGCGRALADQRIEIVNPDTHRPCPADQIGEIWISGPSVAQGYWNQREATAETFQAYLADTGEGPFLRTGDLGFLDDGELFVTGRIKDLIIIRGRNHYPQDIEQTVEQSHPALRPGCCAAFSIQVASEERLVVAQEAGRQATDLDWDKVVQNIRQAVAQEHELQIYGLVLLQAGSIPKTSSGKIQRHACRAGYLSDGLDVVAKSILGEDFLPVETPSTPLQAELIRETLIAERDPAARHAQLTHYLQERVARALRLAPAQVDVEQPLSTLGLDSLAAVELTHEVETGVGVVLPMVDLLQGPNIAQLASQILAEMAEPSVTPLARLVPAQETAVEHPLSHGQRAMWFLHQLAPESAAYNVASAAWLQAELDVPALQRAFQALVNRHPSLRTTFPAPQGEPVQHIHDRIETCFQVEDASTWSGASLNERLVEEAHHPFDLERGPLLRVYLFSRSAQEHILLLVVHHIVADFWSLAVLVDELEMLYPAEQAGVPASLAPLALQYTDYSRWQADMLAGPEGERLWTCWQQQLVGELPALNLPTDWPRPAAQTYRGASLALRLSADLTGRFKAIGRAHGATLYMTLLAAFQTLLHRYTAQEDVLVGSPVAGRNWAELAGLVGYFVNPVVLRADLSGNPPFTVFLDRVRQTVLTAFAHQDYPFGLLVERLQPGRDPSRSPIFQAMFILQQSPLLDKAGLASFALGETGARVDLGRLSLESVALEQRTAQFDLTLVMAEMVAGMGVSLQYNSDLFEAATIGRMLGHFQTLLEGIVAQPEQRLSDLPLLTEAERQQLLVAWNDTKAHFPQDECIHELFEAQVKRRPDVVAMIFEDEHLTYRKLNHRANQLAHYLQASGVGPEVVVGICVERSPKMVIGILGVLKAGGAYVPLEPAYPQERLAFMLEDTRAAALLTQAQLAERLDISRLTPHASLVTLDTDWAAIAQEPDENPKSGATPDNLAYVIYTSGSTGRPKGVAIQHDSAVALIHWAREVFDTDVLAGTLASTSICFDLSIFELFVPLSSGGTVILAETALHLPTLPAAEAVALINTVPSAMGELLRVDGLPPYVRVVNLAGELLQTQLVQQIYQQETVQRVFDLYGPSEDTTYSTYTLRSATGPATIGHPIANTQVYLLDAHLNLVPARVPGELYIGGAGLTRGYLYRPELTAERFIPNPFSYGPGARLYRTGDLARYLPNGELEFLGRIDHQVKIRGFRIELGEVETALRGHPAMEEVVVVAWGDVPGEQRLVAYIVAHQQSAPGSIHTTDHAPLPTISELRSFLKARLPDYMAPSAFVTLAALPLTPNGKVDRRALPAPDATRPELDGVFAAPRTPVEEMLSEIWAKALQLDRVGIYDNFFELGGHSLLATRLMHQVRELFHVDLPLATLFADPTIAHLAAVVERHQTKLKASETGVASRDKPRIQALPRGKGNLGQLVAELDKLSDHETKKMAREQTETGT